IPEDLHADTNQQKRGKPKNYVHARLAEDGGQAVGEAVAKIDCKRYDGRANNGGKNCNQVCAEMVRLVCAQRDGDGDRTWADGERQSQRIKRAAKNVGWVHVLLDLTALVGLFLFEKGPAVGNDNKSAADLDDRNGDAEESKNVSTYEVRSDDKNETVERDAPSEKAACRGRIVARERKEDGGATDRINDGKKGADDEKDTFGNFKQRGLPVRV